MLELKVCIGSACHLNGAHNVVATFQHLVEEYKLHDKINLVASFCMKQCAQKGVAVSINNEETRIQPEEARSFFRENILPLAK